MLFCRGGQSVADRPRGRRHTIRLEYRFDRLFPEKLEQVYEMLLPDQRWLVASADSQANQEEKLNEQTRRHLCSSIFRSTEGESDHNESEGSSKRIRGDSRLSRAGGGGGREIGRGDGAI